LPQAFRGLDDVDDLHQLIIEIHLIAELPLERRIALSETHCGFDRPRFDALPSAIAR
jgi:hypothetical protein